MGISSGRARCCSGQPATAQPPASQRGHTATRAASCTYGQLPLARPSQRPVLRASAAATLARCSSAPRSAHELPSTQPS